MEVTLLVQAADESFAILERARVRAVDLMNTAAKLTSETRWMEEKKVWAIFRGAQETRAGLQNFVVTFVILFFFWALLSGKYDTFHLSLGVICCGIVASFGHDLLFHNVRAGDMRVIAGRFFLYVPWLFYQVVLSNFHVARLVLSPRLPIDPKLIRYKTKLESDTSMVTLANSITLTPGTITIAIENGEFVVHALSRKVADDLNAGDMEDKVAHIFMEADHIYIQDVLDVARIFAALK